MLNLLGNSLRVSPRTPENLLLAGLGVLDSAYAVCREINRPAAAVYPLFSGGHDSYAACYVSSRHTSFGGTVYHIDTGIGSRATRAFVEAVCEENGWRLEIGKSYSTYEGLVREIGFPGPSMHYQCYQRLKGEALAKLTRWYPRGCRPLVLLVNGARRQESVRRMGNTDPFRLGDRTGNHHSHYLWVSPCYDWSAREQADFMDYFDLDRNPVKTSPLAMSGECFCGAFARPGELEMIRQVCPDVAAEIDRLSEVARAAGKPCVWGVRPSGEKGVVVAPTGPLCNSCDRKAAAAGIVIRDVTCPPAPATGGSVANEGNDA